MSNTLIKEVDFDDTIEADSLTEQVLKRSIFKHAIEAGSLTEQIPKRSIFKHAIEAGSLCQTRSSKRLTLTTSLKQAHCLNTLSALNHSHQCFAFHSSPMQLSYTPVLTTDRLQPCLACHSLSAHNLWQTLITTHIFSNANALY